MPYIILVASAVADWLRQNGRENAANWLDRYIKAEALHHGFMRASNRTRDQKHAPDLRYRMDKTASGDSVLCLSNVNIRKPILLWYALIHAAERESMAEASENGKVKNSELNAQLREHGLKAVSGKAAQATRFYFDGLPSGKATKGFKDALEANPAIGEMPATFAGNEPSKPSGSLMIKVTAGDWTGIMLPVPNPDVDLAGAVETYGIIMARKPEPRFWTEKSDNTTEHNATVKYISAVTAALKATKTGTD